MTAPATGPDRSSRSAAVRRLAHAVLTRVVRGRREHGSEWGEAILAEFDQTVGAWAAVRWTVGGIRVVYRARATARRSAPLRVRLTRRLAATLVGALVLVPLVNQFALTVRYQPSGDMQPTVGISDRVLVERLSFRLTDPHPGDLVLLGLRDDQTGQSYQAIKRLVGVPGDRIECLDGRLHRNGAVVAEPYLAAGAATDCEPVDRTVRDALCPGRRPVVVARLPRLRAGLPDRRAGPGPGRGLAGRLG